MADTEKLRQREADFGGRTRGEVPPDYGRLIPGAVGTLTTLGGRMWSDQRGAAA